MNRVPKARLFRLANDPVPLYPYFLSHLYIKGRGVMSCPLPETLSFINNALDVGCPPLYRPGRRLSFGYGADRDLLYNYGKLFAVSVNIVRGK